MRTHAPEEIGEISKYTKSPRHLHSTSLTLNHTFFSDPVIFFTVYILRGLIFFLLAQLLVTGQSEKYINNFLGYTLDADKNHLHVIDFL